MIEVIYKEEKATADEEANSFSVPRNIRQVGVVGENFRIYMEDYVYTFLKKLSEKRVSGSDYGRLAILKGETNWKCEVTYVFVRGAVLAEAEGVLAERIGLSDEGWDQIHREEERYFPDDETVGWFYTEPDLPMRMSSTFDSFHLKYFGADKICMLMDPTEKEEAFFRYENSSLIRQCGYYLYYEKNPQMQSYMIDKKDRISDAKEEAAKDDAVKAFRRRTGEHVAEEPVHSAKRTDYSGFLNYAATACLAFAVLAAGLNFYRSYRQIEQREQPGQKVSSESVIVATATATPTPTATPVPATTPTPTAMPIADKKDETATETLPSEAAATSSPMHDTYVIRPGDTLFQICLEHYGTLDRLAKLCELNGISENDLIYPGEIIVLP